MRVLILCTGNSCRSQMAHGVLKTLAPDWTVCSAGTQPAERVHPMAVAVMNEVGIDIAAHRPTSVQEYLDAAWDVVITVCGGANETCPTFVGRVKSRLHAGFDDPSELEGSQEERLAAFRRVRDAIGVRFEELFDRLERTA